MWAEETQVTFWEHVEDLRQTLIRCLLVIILGMGLSLAFCDSLIHLLKYPLENARKNPELERQLFHKERLANTGKTASEYTLPVSTRPLNLSPGTIEIHPHTFSIPPEGYLDIEVFSRPESLILLSPMEGIVVSFKVCFWTGILVTTPIWIFYIFHFIAPAFGEGERQLIFPFLGFSFVFLLAGLLLAFYVTIPIANRYFYQFNGGLGVNMWSLSHYVSYTLTLLVANGLAFQSFIVLLFLVHFQKISAQFMISKRPHFIVTAFIVGAILTPPDVVTQFLLAVPLIIFYEMAICYAKFKEKKKRKVVLAQS